MKNSYYLLFFLFCGILGLGQTSYSTCGPNKITNARFDISNNRSVVVPNWTFDPAGDERRGWVKDDSFLYAENIFIDRVGNYTATANDATLCSGDVNLASGAKVLKFRYNASNTGPFTLKVRLGNQDVATFTRAEGLAGSRLTTPATVEAKVLREILSRKYIDQNTGETNRFITNNIWHDVEIYIPNYVGGVGNVSFEYERLDGLSRQIRLDDVELYDALPKPIVNQTEVIITNCKNPVYNLTQLQPVATANNYVYEWHTVSTNPTSATKVADPIKAPSGIYYLYIANSNCTSAGCYSLASEAVRVTSNCCGLEKLVNGDFSNFTDNGNKDNITGWLPYRANGTQDNNEFVSVNIQPTFPDNSGSNVLFLDAVSIGAPSLEQSIDVCEGNNYELSFDYAMSFNGFPVVREFEIILGNTKLVRFSIYNYQGDRVRIDELSENTKIYVNDIESQLNDFIANRNEKVKIRIVINNISNLPSNPTLKLKFFREGAFAYFDNISLKSIVPDAPALVNNTLNTSCPANVADLTSLVTPTNITNYNENLTYEWHVSNDISSEVVEDPTSVSEGTYYLFVRSCGGCVSETGVEVTVNSGCPTVSGTIYIDYDGTTNGVSNIGTQTSGGGLFALLVDSDGNVVNSVPITNNGTYEIAGIVGSSFSVLINNEDVASGNPAPTASTLNPSWASTGEEINEVLDGTVNGRSSTFNLVASQDLTNVDFGIQYIPVASAANGAVCNTAGTAVQVPTLSGIDDDPAFANGLGQRVSIKTVQVTNGRLLYGATEITGAYEIASYDPNLLVFEPIDGAEQAILNFTYTFIDSANAESIEAAEVNFEISKELDAVITSTTTQYCPATASQQPIITFSGLNGYSPYTITYKLNGGTDRTIKIPSGQNSVTIPFTETVEGVYKFEITNIQDGIQCSSVISDQSITIYVGCTDSDGDGIPDVVEGSTNPVATDTDGDGVPDYQDLDSDNDGILDIDESNCANNIVINGSFENGSVGYNKLATNWTKVPASETYNETNEGPAEDPDRYVTPDLISNVELQGGYNQDVIAYHGSQAVGAFYRFFNNNNITQEGVRQVISGLTVGESYVLSFYQAVVKSTQPVNSNQGVGDRGHWNVYANRNLLGNSPTIVSNLEPSNQNVEWSKVSFIYTANSTELILDFLVSNDSTEETIYMGLDYVSLKPVSNAVCDTDGDGIPDYRDLDSDNDGVPDVIEGGNGVLDSNNNGYLDAGDTGYVDANGDGLHDGVIGSNTNDFRNPITTQGDTNGDGFPDGIDTDQDGILDVNDTAIDDYGLKLICFVSANTTGTELSTYTGISTLDRNTENNWVSNYKNGFLKLESRSKGFIITRLEGDNTPAVEDAITDPVEGMLIWSIKDQCLKLNIDGTKNGWTCITQGCNQ